MSAQRTPGTWDRNGFNLPEVIVVRDGPDEQGRAYRDGRHQVSIAKFSRIEDAEHCCRAVNAHDDLVASLKGVVRILEAVRYTAGLGKSQLERLEAARALIAKAEGGRS